ncbi:hypothetical protein FS842_003617 [Serendipita sp. 407]|nr:hypothetical protein FS842_003617 [Serendipita sp. 407]
MARCPISVIGRLHNCRVLEKENWSGDRINSGIPILTQSEDPGEYEMDGWPRGYAVFVLLRNDGPRGDHYLFGGPKKYRSAAEFQKHAIWLYFAGRPPQYDEKILLKSSMKQSQINHPLAGTQTVLNFERLVGQEKGAPTEMQLVESSPSIKKVTFQFTNPPTSSPSPTPKSRNRELSREPSTSLVSPLKLPRGNSIDTEESMTHVRLLTISWDDGPKELILPSRQQLNRPSRRYRIGELVWCAVEPPLAGESQDAIIDQWPGIVKSNRVKKSVTDHGVEEEVLYEVKLLALSDALVVPQTMLNPFRSLTSRHELIEVLQAFRPQQEYNPSRELYHFQQNVKYRSSEHQEKTATNPADPFRQASETYSLALQIAGRLVLYWGFAEPHINSASSYLSFSAFWWGSELVYIDEMVVLVFTRSQLAQHPAISGLYSYEDSEDGCVLLQIKTIKVENRRGILVGYLYEPVKLLSSTPPDPDDTLPEQPAPSGYMWKRLLPSSARASLDIQCVVCRYYEDEFPPTIGPTQLNVNHCSVLRALSPGSQFVGMSPTEFVPMRAEMIRKSSKIALEDLREYWGLPLVTY